MTAPPTVSVIMIFLNAERFMEEAIASISAQTFADWELILVDDGSSDGSTGIARAKAEEQPDRVKYCDHPGHVNRGMSPSRRAGVEQARGRFIAFLDADDVWQPRKLEEQVAILEAEPRAALVYGAPLYWHSWTGDASDQARDQVPGNGFGGRRLVEAPALLFTTAPLGLAAVPCPSDILVRRDAMDRVGGFEAAFHGAYEDVAFFVKIFLSEAVFVTDTSWTNYRIHPDQCMSVAVRDGKYQTTRLHFLNWFEEYLSKKGLAGTDAWTLLQAKLTPFRQALTTTMDTDHRRLLTATPNPVPTDSSRTTIEWETQNGSSGQVWVSHDGGHESLFGDGPTGQQEAGWINAGVIYRFRLYADREKSEVLDELVVTRMVDPGVGHESFGSLRRVVPLSRSFGFDRGQPIDRYYIDRFLSRRAVDLSGRVLEVGESTYTKRFGGERVSNIDVLHVSKGNPEATIVADLSNADHLPSEAFDCIVLIQTLHLIFDVTKVIRTLHRMLKPGGILLATFPGISQRSTDEWSDIWYWGFTSTSARRLFTDAFPAEGVTVETYGNVLATTAFLYGFASAELTTDELNYADPSYEMLIAVRAVKAHSSGAAFDGR